MCELRVSRSMVRTVVSRWVVVHGRCSGLSDNVLAGMGCSGDRGGGERRRGEHFVSTLSRLGMARLGWAIHLWVPPLHTQCGLAYAGPESYEKAIASGNDGLSPVRR